MMRNPLCIEFEVTKIDQQEEGDYIIEAQNNVGDYISWWSEEKQDFELGDIFEVLLNLP